MESTTVWILISVGLVVGVAMTVALFVASSSGNGLRSGQQSAGRGVMSPEQWVSLGTIFAGAGVALTLTIGPGMLGMVALGLIYLIVGMKKQREARAGR